MAPTEWDELAARVAATTGLPVGVARRVVDEVVAYAREPLADVVRRRHRELQTAGAANAEIFPALVAELATRPVAAPDLTERQVRRLVYG